MGNGGFQSHERPSDNLSAFTSHLSICIFSPPLSFYCTSSPWLPFALLGCRISFPIIESLLFVLWLSFCLSFPSRGGVLDAD